MPVALPGSEIIDREIEIAGETYAVTCLSMGNPHCVIFTDDVDGVPLDDIGPAIENAEIFPHRANVSFAQIIDRHTVKLRVFERGIGETAACGTGAAAAVAAGAKLSELAPHSDVTVRMRGGNLVVSQREDGLSISGDVSVDFEGTVKI